MQAGYWTANQSVFCGNETGVAMMNADTIDGKRRDRCTGLGMLHNAMLVKDNPVVCGRCDRTLNGVYNPNTDQSDYLPWIPRHKLPDKSDRAAAANTNSKGYRSTDANTVLWPQARTVDGRAD